MITQIEILDTGNYCIEGGQRKPFLDADNKPFLGLLDGKGGRLAPGAEPVYLTADAGDPFASNSAGEHFTPVRIRIVGNERSFISQQQLDDDCLPHDIVESQCQRKFVGTADPGATCEVIMDGKPQPPPNRDTRDGRIPEKAPHG